MNAETETSNNSSANTAEVGNGKRSRNLLIATAVFLIAGVAGFIYWTQIAAKRERTDDAYVAGDQVVVSSRIAGTVIGVQGKDMERVSAGQALVRLDTVDAETQLQKAASALAQSVRQFRQQHEQAGQFDAAIAVQKLDLMRTRDDLARREPLLTQQAIAAEELSHARNAVALAEASLTQTERQARSLHTLIDGTSVRTSPAVLQAKAAYVEAWLNRQRNAVVAPITGHITQHMVKLGQRIQPGQTLLTLVSLNDLWVDANFKEVQLRNMRIGQPVTVVSDLYGGEVVYHGVVAGIGIGTGAAFSLLPAQNASGNWIKVIQRVPVRIALDPKEIAAQPLRIGLSTTVTVDTHDRSGVMLSSAAQAPSSAATNVYATDMVQVEAEAERIIAQQL
jgi:membrane fusion protein (multidrug efflux system)